jgi:hypothetical protein
MLRLAGRGRGGRRRGAKAEIGGEEVGDQGNEDKGAGGVEAPIVVDGFPAGLLGGVLVMVVLVVVVMMLAHGEASLSQS